MRIHRHLYSAICSIIICTCADNPAQADSLQDRGLVADDGTLEVSVHGQGLGHLAIGLYDHNWSYSGAIARAGGDTQGNSRLFRLSVPGAAQQAASLIGVASYSRDADGGLSAAFSFTAEADVALNSLNTSLEVPASLLVGGSWTADRQHGAFVSSPWDYSPGALAEPDVDIATIRLPASGPSKRFGVDVVDNARFGQEPFP